jgi:hypothetical protein
MRRALVLLLLIATSASAVERGKLVENVASRADATQTYTLYLPSSYDAAKKYPLLLVFDPRGRGTMAAEIFRPAAEEYGWILISSNQTRSDVVGESPNMRAIKALLPEVNRYPMASKRLYATGFSGTAILAWIVGAGTGELAGVIGVGGRLVDGIPPEKFSFAHYGFAGDLDFNNREMRLVEEHLEREGRFPHRFQVFKGQHQWITPALAREAVGWMEVLAKNEAVIPKVFAEDVAAADALQGLEALRRYRAILRTYAALAPVEAIRTKVAALESDAAVKRELQEEAKWDEFEKQYVSGVFGRLPNIFATLRAKGSAPTAHDFVRAFRIDELRRRAARPGIEGVTARRLLESVYTQMTFDVTRQLFERRDYATAAAVLEAVAGIDPGRWLAWYNLAAAEARSNRPRLAYLALDKAVAAGFRDAKLLENDEDFAPLRREQRFRDIVSALR